METILINPNLLELVKQENKVTTCRQGIRNYPLGKTILKSNASEDFVYIDIKELRYYKLKDVTNEMAQDDGFINRENLVKVLEGIYQGINDETDITIVHFRLDKIVGYCKECGAEVYNSDKIPDYETVYECSECHHPHAKDELWDEVPYYISR